MLTPEDRKQIKPFGRIFAAERARVASRFSARLYPTAWTKSANVKLPRRLDRRISDARIRDASAL